MIDHRALGARPRATEHERCARVHATQPESGTRAGTTDATDRKSSARAEASRRNGAKSRGPKTALGKARSAQNALKHGLRAHRFVLLADEDTAEFQALEAELHAELAPEGVLQRMIVARLAVTAWRMLRADRMEIELLDPHVGLDAWGQPGGLGLALIRDGHGPRAFPTLLRYRGAVQAEFWRSLRALSALKAEAPAPIELPAAAAPLSEGQRSGPPPTGYPSPHEPEPEYGPNEPERRDFLDAPGDPNEPNSHGAPAGLDLIEPERRALRSNEHESRGNRSEMDGRCMPDKPAERGDTAAAETMKERSSG